MSNDSPYALSQALEYFETLIAEPLILPLTEQNLEFGRVLPTIGPVAAAVLELLVARLRPQRILEIGTSYGYATCVLARAARVHGGQVTTIEIRPELVAAAQQNAATVGLAGAIDFRCGDARELVPALSGPFDLILQDGDKLQYEPLLHPLVELLAPQGLLVSDDVLFPIMELPRPVEHWKQAMTNYNRTLAKHPSLRTVWLPIGDGVAVSIKHV